MPAKGLNLIDIGGLERQHRQERNAEDGADVIPGKAIDRHHVPEIERKPDRRDQGDFDHAHDAGKHDRRIGPLETLRGDLERGGRERARRRRFRPARGIALTADETAAAVSNIVLCSGPDMVTDKPPACARSPVFRAGNRRPT